MAKVLLGIDAAIAAGFERISSTPSSWRAQSRRGAGPGRLRLAKGINISFIEEMPLGLISDHDRAEAFYSSDQIRQDLAAHFTLIPTTKTTGGPARYYRIPGSKTRVGFISPHSHNFCGDCNRVRVTTEGRLLLCLGQEHSLDLRAILRGHPEDSARLGQAIREAMQIKPKGHEFDVQAQPIIFRHMNRTGG